MRIVGSDVNLQANYLREQTLSRTERLNVWGGARPGANPDRPAVLNADRLELSAKARSLMAQLEPDANAVTRAEQVNNEITADWADRDRLALVLIERVMRALTGKDYRFSDVRPIDRGLAQRDGAPPAVPADVSAAATAEAPGAAPAGWGLRYDATETRVEVEQSTFAASGTVTTADGRSIRFALDFSLARQEVSTTSISVRAGDALKDPLIISLDTLPAGLTDAAYAFDINRDGKSEAIPLPRAGSGFLVFDRNGDGKVNDGSELFGPATGNGFGELATLDTDGNGWLDEADAAWARLAVWPGGDGKLISAAAAGLGAINVRSVSTPFALKAGTAPDSAMLGQLRASGVYLTEDGRAGLIQQADLAVGEPDRTAHP